MSPPERRNSERRINPERRASTFDLVEQAAEVAAQNVARIHRRRLVSQCFLAALICSLAVCLPLTLKLNHDRAVAATANARFNCTQWNEGSTVLRLFVESDAKLRRDQQNLSARAGVLTGFSKLLGKGLVKELVTRGAKLDRDAQHLWLSELVPRLQRLARVNCDAILTTAGPRTTATK